MTAGVLPLPRPSWRGRLHTWAFAATVPCGAVLIAVSDRAAARVAAAVYVVTLLLVFGISASYHRLANSPSARRIMQRFDHSAIYLLIAGTYVPFCLVALPLAWGIPILSVVGTAAVTGVILKLAVFDRASRLSYALYPIMGWAVVPAIPVLLRYLSTAELGLLVAGGLVYTVGIPVLAKQRPDPWPRTFGYHEIWHVFTVVAAVLHFAAVSSVVT